MVTTMVRTFIRRGDGSVSQDTSREAIAAALADPKSVFWLDIEAPTDDEVAILRDVFHFHPLTIEDSVTYTQRPKIEHYTDTGDAQGNGYCYLVFHGPDLETFRSNLRTKEIDIFVAERYLVSVHDEPLRTVGEITAMLKADPRELLTERTDRLLHAILDRIVDHYQEILDYLEEALSELEEEALNAPSPEVLSKIAIKKREMLNLRRVVGPQREVVAQLARGDVQYIRESTRVYMRDVQDKLVRTVEMIELYRDLVLGSRDIYLSSVSNNLNQVMKTLTIISVIGLPMTIVTGFFGMNFDEPIFHDHRVFIGALVFMALVVTSMLYLFHKKRWI